VSHDINTISSFCDHAILLENGQIVEQGQPRHISMVYYRLIFGEQAGSTASTNLAGPAPDPQAEAAKLQKQLEERERLRQLAQQTLQQVYVQSSAPQPPASPHELRAGTRREAEVIDFGIRDMDGNGVTLLESGKPYTFFVVAVFPMDVPNPAYGFLVRNSKGVDMYGIDTRGPKIAIRPHRRGEILEGLLHITMWLTNGEYFLSAGIGSTDGIPFDFRYDGLTFTLPRLPDIQHASVINLQPRFEFGTLGPLAVLEQTPEATA